MSKEISFVELFAHIGTRLARAVEVGLKIEQYIQVDNRLISTYG